MAKKKKEIKKHTDSQGPRISLPETAKRKIASVFFLVIAILFLFAFFGKAGSAGAFLLSFFSLLFGKAVFLAPLFCVVAGITLFVMKRWGLAPVFFALALLISGVSGVIGTASRAGNMNVTDVSGLVGQAVSWPVFAAFGFWVGEIVFGALFVIGSIILWQLLDHEKAEEADFAQGAREKVRKIFEPKLEPKIPEEPAAANEPKVVNLGEDQALPKAEKKRDKEDKTGTMETLPASANYEFPPTSLLEEESGVPNAGDVKVYSAIIKKTLGNFDIPVEIAEVNIGPAVTQYAFKPAEGIKLARITALSNDLSLALAAHPLRIEAPIPGKSLVGIEIPNKTRTVVRLRNLLENPGFTGSSSPLLLTLGKDVSGLPVFSDLARMPHLLVAGATGAGKTIALSNIILSLIFRNSPSTLRFILVDPKRVEFPVYNELPHLLTPVILDTQRSVNALKWLIKEMERRFQVLSSYKVRDIGSYHELLRQQLKEPKKKKGKEEETMEDMPYIVVVIDELADLMMARGKEIEAMIVRLAQMARAIGIHLVLATQRPSVEVITGLIKANITGRMAFQVASQIDSRTILDSAGAEKLLGRGDMLFLSGEFSRPKRIQGAYISDKDVKRVVQWIEKNRQDNMADQIPEDELAQSATQGMEISGPGEGGSGGDADDPSYEEARRVVVEAKKASASLLQRRLKIGYARAARLLDLLEERGVIGPGEGAKPREVYGIPRAADIESVKAEGFGIRENDRPGESAPPSSASNWFQP